MHNKYYTPSGRVNSISFLYLFLAIFIAAPLLTFIYTYAVLYIPIVYLNILCVVGIAFGLGYIANFVVGLGKVRNKMVALLFGLIIGISALYFSWIIWLHYHLNDSAFNEITYTELLEAPGAVWDIVWKINEQGTWSIGRSSRANVSGTFLTIVWILELIAFIGAPIFFAFSKAAEPFLEDDNNWADITKIGPFEPIEDKKALKKQLETQNYEAFLEIGPLTNEQNSSHAIFSLYHNKKRTHGNEYYLSVSNMKERIDKKGNVTHDEKSLISFIRVPKEIGEKLLAKIGTSAEVPVAESE
ncbi:hypothetical protein EZY14_005070 [Kordia sp. TARA_039_SRF]|nr:hypothetical protein EZY14_005070 [Kordia sp. TARA_039_SRF]